MSQPQSTSIQALFDLADRTALVIGGTGYLGTAISQALAEAGARVVVAGRSQERAAAAAALLPGPTGRHLGIACEATEEMSVRRCVDQTAQQCGGLDVLVNAMGGGSTAKLDEAKQVDLVESLSVNLIGPFIASQQAAIHMRDGDGGSIIHIGSMYGMVGSYPQIYEDVANSSPPAYHAAKAGLIHLTRYQAVYWAKDRIRVNCISPGPFPRPVQHAGREIFLARLAERVPLGRCAESWEIKGAVVFLASEASSFVTGHNLVVDGGWTAW